MPKKLLEKLGLRRRRRRGTQDVVQNPVDGHQAPPQPVQQPPQQPVQQPPQQRWVAPSKTGRKEKAGPLNKQAQARQDAFVSRLQAAMPIVRKAKQFALTVDGQRIEATKSEEDEEFKKAVTDLARQLTPQIMVLDTHSST